MKQKLNVTAENNGAAVNNKVEANNGPENNGTANNGAKNVRKNATRSLV